MYTAKAQVSLAPTAVFIDKTGVGTLYLTNSSDIPQEVSISTEFGYPMMNAEGGLAMIYGDTVRAKENGVDAMLKIFPRTFILPPRQQQLVRFNVRPPKDLKPGVYFSRLKVATAAQVSDVGVETSNNGVVTRVNVRFEQVVAVFYKAGEVTTGVAVDNIVSNVDSNRVMFTLDYRTTGNSPYLGKVKSTIKKSSGEVVAEINQTIAYYYSGKRKIEIPLGTPLLPGRYDVEFTFETTRGDIPAEDLVKAKPSTVKTSLQVK